MGYRIIYESETELTRGKSGVRRIFLSVGFFLCFLLSVAGFWPEGREMLRILLIPGDPDITMEAAEVFAQELSCGYSLKDAAQNFCIAVWSNGVSG